MTRRDRVGISLRETILPPFDGRFPVPAGKIAIVFGRVLRAVASCGLDSPVTAFGVLRTYDPMVIGSALALGMGAAAATSGAAMARDRSGRLVSATSTAVERVTSWASRDRLRYARLPHSVLAVVMTDEVKLFTWTSRGRGHQVATWARGSYRAVLSRDLLQNQVRVELRDGKIALLSAPAGPHHWGRRRALAGIAALADPHV